MAVTVVVGGQYGSEGKGKVASIIAAERRAQAVVRVGGPNSGHTPHWPGTEPLRQLPTAAYTNDCFCVLPAGSYIDLEVLKREIVQTGISIGRVIIDPLASIVTATNRMAEESAGLTGRIGSTASGTGQSVVNRVARSGEAVLARDVPELAGYLQDVPTVLRRLVDEGAEVILEGSQGSGLSVLHADHYPFATSRDTTAAGVLSEVGLSPLDVGEVVLVIRALPIRVGGNSGPLTNELSWQEVSRLGAHDHPIAEYTTVTHRLRRIGRFDPAVVRRSLALNKPSMVVMNHLDYLDHSACLTGVMTQAIDTFLVNVESSIGRSIDRLGVGPAQLLDRSGNLRLLKGPSNREVRL